MKASHLPKHATNIFNHRLHVWDMMVVNCAINSAAHSKQVKRY